MTLPEFDAIRKRQYYTNQWRTQGGFNGSNPPPFGTQEFFAPCLLFFFRDPQPLMIIFGVSLKLSVVSNTDTCLP